MDDLTLMAIRITPENHGLALAFLDDCFAKRSVEQVDGCWLVINEITTAYDPDEKCTKVVVQNSWQPDGFFRRRYEFVHEELDNQGESWTEIRKKNR